MHSDTLNYVQTEPIFDAVGVGIGPFNLSVAALVEGRDELKTIFYERAPEFQWHPGLLFPESTVQVSYLKDLVTLADPTSRYSFLAFLAASGRLYRFINANFDRVPRAEFNQYFRWVAAQLTNLEFGHEVRSITFDRTSFLVDAGDRVVRTRSIVLGTGLRPSIPECASPYLGRTVFHASEYLHRQRDLTGRRVVVIGGGQTGAEVVYHMLADTENRPDELSWISRRSNFLPLDESPFTNELFTPAYSNYFYRLPPEERLLTLSEQRLASDGISPGLLQKLYQIMYQDEFLCGRRRAMLHPRCELVAMDSSSCGWTVSIRGGLQNRTAEINADIVVLATGFEYAPTPALAPILDRTSWSSDGFSIREDYTIEWDGPSHLKIYIQNGARRYRGIADPNLSLMAWRSANIINSLAGREIYPLHENGSVFDFQELNTLTKVAQ